MGDRLTVGHGPLEAGIGAQIPVPQQVIGHKVMKTVTKKITKQWLDKIDKIIAGKKKFELRLADFEIKEDDILKLEEYSGIDKDRKPTGRSINKKVKYLQKVDLKSWIKQQPELLENGFYVIQFD